MSDMPTEYTPEADVPLDTDPVDTDPRAVAVADAAAVFQDLIRTNAPAGPQVELAIRYVDLATQSARQAIQDAPVIPEEPPTGDDGGGTGDPGEIPPTGDPGEVPPEGTGDPGEVPPGQEGA